MSEKRGAQLSKISLMMQLAAWRKDHKRVAKDSFNRLKSKPLHSLMTILVIAIALSLPVSFYVLLANAQKLGGQWQSAAQISLYLDARASAQAIESLRQNLASWPEIESLQLISKEQGLAEFKQNSGFADALQQLPENPLPVVIEVLPSAAYQAADKALLLKDKLAKQPLVQIAQLDMQWLQKLIWIIDLGQRLSFALVLLFSLAVLLVIGNTIRLEVENRRDEINVVKLIGATYAFVRRPFLYLGFYYGVTGGILASLIVALILAFLDEPVSALAGLYQSQFSLQGLTFFDTVSLWLLAALLGVFGAWLAVGRHLDEMES